MSASKPWTFVCLSLIALGFFSKAAAEIDISHEVSNPLSAPTILEPGNLNLGLDDSSLPENWAGLDSKALSPEQKTRLKEVLSLARTIPTGRTTLRKMEELARKKGNYPVSFASLGKNLGQYDYATGTLQLNHQFLHEDLRLSVSTLIHEMTHILQHSQNIPAEALEMELEAYALHMKALKELKTPVEKWDPFSRDAVKLLKRNPQEYIDWMAEQHPGKFLIEKNNGDEIAEFQEEELERQDKQIERLREKIEESPKNPALKRRMKRAQMISHWIERDISLLRSPKALARYHRFSKRVHSFLNRIGHAL